MDFDIFCIDIESKDVESRDVESGVALLMLFSLLVTLF